MRDAFVNLSIGACLLLSAGCPSGQAATTDGTSGGETGSSTTTTTGTSDAPTTAAATTSTGEPATSTSSTSGSGTSTSTGSGPAVCGDGVVADTEVCDDGNDDPDDGCDENCAKTGAVEWTYTYNGAASKEDGAAAVAVDGTGRIIVAGWETGAEGDSDMLLIALGPDGAELWRKTFAGAAGEDDAFSDVVVDEDGNIYAGGYEMTMPKVSDAIVRAFDPDGGELWTYADPPPVADTSAVHGVFASAGVLYSVGTEALLDAGAQLVVRAHYFGSGEALWKTSTQEGTMLATGRGIAVVGTDVIAVGAAVDNNTARPLIAVFTDAGDLVSTDIEDHPNGLWFDVAPIGGAGDLVLAGRRLPAGDVAVRRVGPDLAETWTVTYDHAGLYDAGSSVAVGPDEAILVAGVTIKVGELDNIFAGRWTAEGALLWTHTYDNPDIHLDDHGNAAAFGPGFVVLGGTETVLGEKTNVFVRRLKAD